MSGQPGSEGPSGDVGPPAEGGYPQYGSPQQGAPQYGAAPQYGSSQYGGAPQYGGYGRPPAPKPGVVPLRPLGLGEILDGAVTTMRRYPKPTFTLSAAVAAVGGLLALLQGPAVFADSGAALGISTAGVLLSGVVGIGTEAVLVGALTLVLAEGVLGRPVTLAQVWARLRPRVWGLVGLGFVTALLVFLGLFAFFIGALVVGVFLLLAGPVYVLEGASVTGALRRSRDLVRGSWWRVFGIYALATLLVAVVSGIVTFPLGIAFGVTTMSGGGDVGFLAFLLFTLATTLVTVLVAPVTAYVAALLYVDQRMRKEGLDLQLAQAAGAGQGGEPQYGQSQYGQSQYGQSQYGQSQYGQPQPEQPSDGSDAGDRREPGAGPPAGWAGPDR